MSKGLLKFFFLFLSFRIKKYVKDASSEMVFEAGMKDWLCFSLVSSGFFFVFFFFGGLS